MSTDTTDRGSFAIVVGVLLAAVLFAAGVVWFLIGQKSTSGPSSLSKQKTKPACTISPRPREFTNQPYYTGPLIDNHVHMPMASGIAASFAQRAGLNQPALGDDGLTVDYLVCLIESENTKQIFGYHVAPSIMIGPTVSVVKNIERDYPGKIVPFLMPPPIAALNPDPGSVRNVLSENRGLFRGYGELAFYMESFSANPQDPPFQEMYKLAQQHNLIVMIHPGRGHRGALEKTLADNPDVRFLIHSEETEEWLSDLFKNYPNVYYSLDANTTSLYGYGPEHQFKKPTKEEWLGYIRQNFHSKLDEQTKKWKSKIEANPDRFVWGTDRWYSWHFDQEASGLLIEFSRAFIGRLDPAVQEKFAYQNAQKLLEFER